MAPARIERTTSATFYGSFTVDDLRAFLTDDLPGAARVTVNYYPGDQRDGSSLTLTVHGVGA